MGNAIPPVPPLGPKGFEDPVWARWLQTLRQQVGTIATSVMIQTANGFSGTTSILPSGVAEIALSTTVFGMLKGNGTQLLAAMPGVDYLAALTLTGDATGMNVGAFLPVTLAPTGVIAGTYGDGTHYPTFTVDAKGRLTSASSVLLGTMAYQNATSVSITGGSIDGATVGSTTRAAGAFTTLSDSMMSSVVADTEGGQNIPNATVTTLTGWSASRNVGSNFVPSTGVYTVPFSGLYDIRAAIAFINAGVAADTQCLLAPYLNGVQVLQNGVTYQTATAVIMQTSGSWLIYATAGQLLTIRAFQNSGGAVTLNTASLSNWLMIQQTTHV
jgi:hypothetical protein